MIIKQELKNERGIMRDGILLCLFVVIVIVSIVIEIYIWATYGQTPLDEIPTWVLFFMFKR